MFTDAQLNQAMEIVSVLDIPMEFGSYEGDGGAACEMIRDQIDISGLDIGEYDVASGISKAVIVPHDLPYVIKIPFHGQFCGDWDEDDHYQYDFWFFEDACAEAPADYCRDELEKIDLMNHFGFGQLTVETRWLCEVDGQDFYIQEKVKCGRSNFKSSAQSEETARSMERNYRIGPIEWLANVIEYFGESLWRQFVDWNLSEEEHYLIDDLHCGNVGLTYDGRPIMFDVSGFRD